MAVKRVTSLIAVGIIIATTVLVYDQLSTHRFLSLDDSVYVTGNPYVLSGISRENISWALTTFRGEFWHPVTWISYMIDTELYGVRAGGYLFSNLILHIINTVLVFYLFQLFFQREWEGVFIAALFALHPLHVEPVAWISERKELLAAFFWLTALLAYWFYAQLPTWKRYFPVVILFIVGFMAKSMIITLPFLLLVIDYWPLKRDLQLLGGGSNRLYCWWCLAREKGLLFILMLAGIGITLWAQQNGGGTVSLTETSLGSRLANAMLAYVLYIQKTLWPIGLSVFYPFDKQINIYVVASCATVLAGLSFLAIWASRLERFFLTGWFWFLGTLIPVIGLVQFGDFFMADRFMYMPILGIFLIVAGGLRLLIQRLSRQRLWLAVVPLMFVGVYLPLTFWQIQTWRDSRALYGHALQTVKNNYLAHHALGETFAREGDFNKAVDHFSKAVERRPDKAAFWVKLGRAQAATGAWHQAKISFSQAALLKPDHPKPRFYLGCTALLLKDYTAAVDHLSFSLEKIWRDNRDDKKLFSKAVYYYKKGRDCDKKNLQEAAIQWYQQALAVRPDYFPAVKALSHIYQKTGRQDDIWGLYGIALTPDKLRHHIIVGFEQWKAVQSMSPLVT